MSAHARSDHSRLVPKTGPRRRVAQVLEAGLKGRRPALYAAQLAGALPAVVQAPAGETLWRSALIGPARYPSGSRDAVILAEGRLIPAVVRQRHRDGNVHVDPRREIRCAVVGAPGQDRAQRPLVPSLQVDSAWLRDAARRHDIPLSPSLAAELIQAAHAACAAARATFRATLDPEVAWLLQDDSDLERFHNWLSDDHLADEIVRRRQAAFAALGHGCEHIRSRDAVAQRLDAGEDPFRLLAEVLDAAPDALKRLAGRQPQALASLEEAQRKARALEFMPPSVLEELSDDLDIAGGWAARAMSLASLAFSDPAQRRDAARRLLSRPGLRRFVDYPARFDDWSFDEGTKDFAGLLSAVVRFGLLPPVMLEAAGRMRNITKGDEIAETESKLAQIISRSIGIMTVELARLQWRKVEPWLAKNLIAACHPSRHSWPSLITHQTDRTSIDCLTTQDELEELGARLMLGPTILHDILVEGHHVLRLRDNSGRTVAVTAVRQADLEAAARRRRVDEHDTKRDGWAVNAQWKRLMPVEVARLIDRIAKRKVKVRLSHVRRQINSRAAAAARLRAMPCGFDPANADARGLAEAALAPIMRLLVRNADQLTDRLFGPPRDPELEADAAFLKGRRPGRCRKRATAASNPATNIDALSPLLRPAPEAVIDVPATYSPAAAAERIKRSIIRGKPAVPKDPMKARFVVIDVETTGLDEADRIVELAAIELTGPRATGRTYEVLVDPQRVISDGAFAKHGISHDMLRGMVTFKEIATYLIAFLRRPGTWLVAHNAAFDIGVINRELERVGSDTIRPANRAICTLKMAASPGTPSDLDSVCDALKIDRSRRQKHRAMVDAQLCAEVFRSLVFGGPATDTQKAA